MLEKMKDMWKNLKTPLRMFLIFAACILVFALGRMPHQRYRTSHRPVTRASLQWVGLPLMD